MAIKVNENTIAYVILRIQEYVYDMKFKAKKKHYENDMMKKLQLLKYQTIIDGLYNIYYDYIKNYNFEIK